MISLVTGGNSDIGFSLASELYKRGDKIIVSASTESSSKIMKKRYDSADIPMEAIIFDLSHPKESINALKTVTSSGIDNLILNAWTRIPANKRLHELGDHFFQQHIQENVVGNTWLLQQTLPKMLENKYGRIVFISSMSTVTGTGRYAPYIAGKSAMEGLMKNIAVDYGDQNIYANTLRLGIFKTERNKKYWRRGDYERRMSSIIPSAKLGDPSSIGSALTPLVSESQYINGSCIDVAGGLPCLSFSGVLQP